MLHKGLELLRLLLVDDADPTLPEGSAVLRIDIILNPAQICLNNRALVLDPVSLRVLVSVHVTSFITLNILLKHVLLILVLNIVQRLLQVVVGLLKIWGELAVIDIKLMVLEVDVFSRLVFVD